MTVAWSPDDVEMFIDSMMDNILAYGEGLQIEHLEKYENRLIARYNVMSQRPGGIAEFDRAMKRLKVMKDIIYARDGERI